MTTCLTKSQIEQHTEEIRDEFHLLLERLRVARRRPDAMQWQFFQHCFKRVIGDEGERFDFRCESDQAYRRATEYKHEVSKCLRWYYGGAYNSPINYVFRLEHASKRGRFIPAGEDYPSDDFYLFLIHRAKAADLIAQELHNVLYRVVDGAMHAEFTLYSKLPTDGLRALWDHFDPAGKAYARISHHMRRRLRNQEVISNESNPSFKKLRHFKVLHADGESALVETRERWLLKWWSLEKREYAPHVEERGVKSYTLVKRGRRWLVSDSDYKRPARSRS